MNTLYHKLKIYGARRFFWFLMIDLRRKFWNEIMKGSFSQQGEDLIIDHFVDHKKNGFYVDIGAYDPHRFSNTKRFYLKGWQGINIEPNIKNFQKFKRQRLRDTNINMGIGKSTGKLTFYEFVPDTLSTFSKKEADSYLRQGYSLAGRNNVNVSPLRNILKKYVKKKKIDFFSIDTEGMEMEVLETNDWTRFKPRVICIESALHRSNDKNLKRVSSIEAFLRHESYDKVYENETNSIFVLKKPTKSV